MFSHRLALAGLKGTEGIVAERAEITLKTVVYQIAGMDGVTVRRDLEYGARGLRMDIYYPPDSKKPAPAVVIVAGFPDPGFEKFAGCKFKDQGSTVSWARLMAASGIAAIAYTNVDPVADVHAVIESLRRNAAALGIDGEKIGVWACSGSVPLALWVVMRERVKCAALCYGFTMDLDGSTEVAEGVKQWRFANPAAGQGIGIDALPKDVPLMMVRAGADQFAGLNQAMDWFAAAALRANLPVSLVNLPAAPHAFDLVDDGEESREAIRRVLGFLKFHLVD